MHVASVAETSQRAGDIFYGPQAAVMNRIGHERAAADQPGPDSTGCGLPGALFVRQPGRGRRPDSHARGAGPGIDRFLIQGGDRYHGSRRKLMRRTELSATRVAPGDPQAAGA